MRIETMRKIILILPGVFFCYTILVIWVYFLPPIYRGKLVLQVGEIHVGGGDYRLIQPMSEFKHLSSRGISVVAIPNTRFLELKSEAITANIAEESLTKLSKSVIQDHDEILRKESHPEGLGCSSLLVTRPTKIIKSAVIEVVPNGGILKKILISGFCGFSFIIIIIGLYIQRHKSRHEFP